VPVPVPGPSLLSWFLLLRSEVLISVQLRSWISHRLPKWMFGGAFIDVTCLKPEAQLDEDE
jgi:hypothetical protein